MGISIVALLMAEAKKKYPDKTREPALVEKIEKQEKAEERLHLELAIRLKRSTSERMIKEKELEILEAKLRRDVLKMQLAEIRGEFKGCRKG